MWPVSRLMLASVLPEISLDRGIESIGNPIAASRLFRKLDAGDPIVLGVIGASIAQNAGCLDQGQSRCMNCNGQAGPRHKAYKGFAVRLLDHINHTWPHAMHRINNSAMDATPFQTMQKCLFSHLPDRLDLVILEFGSSSPPAIRTCSVGS